MNFLYYVNADKQNPFILRSVDKDDLEDFLHLSLLDDHKHPANAFQTHLEFYTSRSEKVPMAGQTFGLRRDIFEAYPHDTFIGEIVNHIGYTYEDVVEAHNHYPASIRPKVISTLRAKIYDSSAH